MKFIPYAKQSITTGDIENVIETLKSPYITSGPKVEEFESDLASYCGAKYCVAVSNGTAALHLSSLILLREGDKVLTTPNSFLATSNSILYVGAKPKFVDICENGNIDLDLCEEELLKDPSIKAIYAVAFAGNMLDQKKLKHLKDTYNILILEDCSHAIGAKDLNGIKAGSCRNSDMSTFSFHPVKHMTTGEGGAITTNNDDIYQRLLLLRSHGVYKDATMKPWEYEMRELGLNYRITDIQCALGISQLKKLDGFIQRRHSIAHKYDKSLLGSKVKPLHDFETQQSSYHLYVVQVDFDAIGMKREKLFGLFKEQNIGIQVHYIPINRQPYYKKLGYGIEKTPVMDNYYQQCLSLPIYPNLTQKQQQYIIDNLSRVVDE